MVKMIKTNLKTKKDKSLKNLKRNKTNVEKKKKAVDFFLKDFAEEITQET
jgi:hypothetical protein